MHIPHPEYKKPISQTNAIHGNLEGEGGHEHELLPVTTQGYAKAKVGCDEGRIAVENRLILTAQLQYSTTPLCQSTFKVVV
jgi:hypothetical protein